MDVAAMVRAVAAFGGALDDPDPAVVDDLSGAGRSCLFRWRLDAIGHSCAPWPANDSRSSLSSALGAVGQFCQVRAYATASDGE